MIVGEVYMRVGHDLRNRVRRGDVVLVEQVDTSTRRVRVHLRVLRTGRLLRIPNIERFWAKLEGTL
jgi:hypothetical protein